MGYLLAVHLDQIYILPSRSTEYAAEVSVTIRYRLVAMRESSEDYVSPACGQKCSQNTPLPLHTLNNFLAHAHWDSAKDPINTVPRQQRQRLIACPKPNNACRLPSDCQCHVTISLFAIRKRETPLTFVAVHMHISGVRLRIYTSYC